MHTICNSTILQTLLDEILHQSQLHAIRNGHDRQAATSKEKQTRQEVADTRFKVQLYSVTGLHNEMKL